MKLKELINNYGIESGTIRRIFVSENDKMLTIQIDPDSNKSGWEYDLPKKSESILITFTEADLSNVPTTELFKGQTIERLERKGDSGLSFVCAHETTFTVEAEGAAVLLTK